MWTQRSCHVFFGQFNTVEWHNGETRRRQSLVAEGEEWEKDNVGFQNCNREVITHSELTLQMDELLECALPRLRVRKLHMHKTKMGEGEHHIGWSQRNSQTPFDISLSSLCLPSHFNAMGSQSSETQDWDWTLKESVTQMDCQEYFDCYSESKINLLGVFSVSMLKWAGAVLSEPRPDTVTLNLEELVMRKISRSLRISVEVELLWLEEQRNGWSWKNICYFLK